MSTKKQILNVFRSKNVKKVFSMKIGYSIMFLLVSDMAKKKEKRKENMLAIIMSIRFLLFNIFSSIRVSCSYTFVGTCYNSFYGKVSQHQDHGFYVLSFSQMQ